MTKGGASLLADCSEFSTQHVPVSQEREALTGSHNGSVSGDLSQVLPKSRLTVGIMVFSSSCTMLYANQIAFELLKVLNRWENGHATYGVLPVSVADLFDQMRVSIASRMMNLGCERLEARRVLVGPDPAVLLQAFGLLDRLGMRESRVVITMQGVIHPVADPCGDAISISI